MVDRGFSYPMVMGHEVVGEVVSMGPQASGVTLGDRMVVYPWLGCGECQQCRSENSNACPQGRPIGLARPGGYADHLLVPNPDILVPIEGIDPSWAATLACSGLTSYAAVRKVMKDDPQSPITVIGAGGVGLAAISMMTAMGHENTIAVDLSDENLERAAQAGAARTVRITADTTGSDLLQDLGGEVSAVIDFVNNTQTAAMVFDVLSKGGTMVQVGLFGGELVVPTSVLAIKMITICGNFVGSLREFKELVALAREGRISPTPLHPRPLSADSVRDTLDQLEEGRSRGRVVLVAG